MSNWAGVVSKAMTGLSQERSTEGRELSRGIWRGRRAPALLNARRDPGQFLGKAQVEAEAKFGRERIEAFRSTLTSTLACFRLRSGCLRSASRHATVEDYYGSRYNVIRDTFVPGPWERRRV